MSDTQYIPSTTPGKTWSVSTYKPDGRPGYAVASEGVYEQEAGSGFSSFTTVLFQDPIIREPVAGRMTAKNRNAALIRLFDRMLEEKKIPEGSELKTVY